MSDETDKVTEFSKEAWYRVIKGAFELEDVIEEQYGLIQQGLKAMRLKRGRLRLQLMLI